MINYFAKPNNKKVGFVYKFATISSFFLGLTIAFPNLAYAQTNLEILEIQKKEAELKEAIAKAEEARIKAEDAAFRANNFPTKTVAPLEGGTSINTGLGSTLPIESEILVYQALEQIIPKFTKKINSSGINLNSSNIVIDDGTIISQSLESYNNYRSQAMYFRDSCNKQLNLTLPALPNPGIASAAVGPAALLDLPSSILGSIANIASFFRTKAEFGGKAVVIEKPAYVAKLASLLNQQNVNVYFTSFSTLNDGMPYILADVEILGRCLRQAKSSGSTDISTPLTTFLNKIFDAPNFASTSPPAIQLISKGASVQAILNKPKSFILYFGTIAGGTNRITNNLFTGSKLRHSGGIIHYYSLIDRSGAIKFSDFDYLYTGFKKLPISEDLKK